MNKIIVALAITLIVNSSHGDCTLPENNLTQEEQQEIAWALQILSKYNLLIPSEKNCTKIKPSLIEKLQSEGLLTTERNIPMKTICIGASN